MAKCNDCWCEHYSKDKGNCSQCVKSETPMDKLSLDVILKRRVVEKMDIESKNNANGQKR